MDRHLEWLPNCNNQDTVNLAEVKFLGTDELASTWQILTYGGTKTIENWE